MEKDDLTSGLEGGTAKEQHQRKEEVFRRDTAAEERRRDAAARSAIGESRRVRVRVSALRRSEVRGDLLRF